MVNLGLRRSDACRIGPNDIKGGRLTDFEPQKTKGTTGVKLTLPIHPELAEAIAAMTAVGTKTFLVQEARGRKGQPFKNGESGGAWMREQCDAAGLHQPRLAQGGGDPPGADRLYRTRTAQGVRLYAGTGAGLC